MSEQDYLYRQQCEKDACVCGHYENEHGWKRNEITIDPCDVKGCACRCYRPKRVEGEPTKNRIVEGPQDELNSIDPGPKETAEEFVVRVIRDLRRSLVESMQREKESEEENKRLRAGWQQETAAMTAKRDSVYEDFVASQEENKRLKAEISVKDKPTFKKAFEAAGEKAEWIVRAEQAEEDLDTWKRAYQNVHERFDALRERAEIAERGYTNATALYTEQRERVDRYKVALDRLTKAAEELVKTLEKEQTK